MLECISLKNLKIWLLIIIFNTKNMIKFEFLNMNKKRLDFWYNKTPKWWGWLIVWKWKGLMTKLFSFWWLDKYWVKFTKRWKPRLSKKTKNIINNNNFWDLYKNKNKCWMKYKSNLSCNKR